ncbi:RNA polymerase sigma factor [Bacteroides sp. 51]|nr:RNA polymerase sigma factor [Bacteroides sp. 51]
MKKSLNFIQETSIKTLDNENKYNPKTNFKGWMYIMMRNLFINNYKRVVREQTHVDHTENLYHLNLPQTSEVSNAESTYDLKEVRHVLNELSKEYKIPFSMHIAGFEYHEIADKLGLPLGTVKSRIFFTHRRLQLQSGIISDN